MAKVSPAFTVQDKRTDNPIFIHSYVDDLGLDPYTFRVYCRLSRRAGSGAAFESVGNMAKGCKMSDRQIRRCLRNLEKMGMIKRENRTGESSVYCLVNRENWKATPDSQSAHPGQVVRPTPDSQSAKGIPIEGTPLKVKKNGSASVPPPPNPHGGKNGGGSPAAASNPTACQLAAVDEVVRYLERVTSDGKDNPESLHRTATAITKRNSWNADHAKNEILRKREMIPSGKLYDIRTALDL